MTDRRPGAMLVIALGIPNECDRARCQGTFITVEACGPIGFLALRMGALMAFVAVRALAIDVRCMTIPLWEILAADASGNGEPTTHLTQSSANGQTRFTAPRKGLNAAIFPARAKRQQRLEFETATRMTAVRCERFSVAFVNWRLA